MGSREVVPPAKSKGDAENIRHFKYRQNASPEGWHLREASEGQRGDSLHRRCPRSIQKDNPKLYFKNCPQMGLSPSKDKGLH